MQNKAMMLYVYPLSWLLALADGQVKVISQLSPLPENTVNTDLTSIKTTTRINDINVTIYINNNTNHQVSLPELVFEP